MAEGRSKKATNGRRKGPWSTAELERLKRLYGQRPDAQIARELHRSVESVRRMARRTFSGEARLGPWSAAEVQSLKNYLGAAELEVISMILRRSEREVERKIRELQNVHHRGEWSSDDVQDLKRLYGTRADEDLAVILGRPMDDMLAMARTLCLAKDKGFRRRNGAPQPTRMPRWTEGEKKLLAELYSESPNLEIARQLSRSVKSVVSKAHDMGLRKSIERLRDMGRENVQIRYQQDLHQGGGTAEREQEGGSN